MVAARPGPRLRFVWALVANEAAVAVRPGPRLCFLLVYVLRWQAQLRQASTIAALVHCAGPTSCSHKQTFPMEQPTPLLLEKVVIWQSDHQLDEGHASQQMALLDDSSEALESWHQG